MMKQALVFLGLLAGVQAADIHLLRGASWGVPMNNAVVQRSMEELKIAQNANAQAKATAQAARTQQENYVAHVTIEKAMKKYEKIEKLVPKTRAATLKVRGFAMVARQHADHTKEVEAASRRIPEIAAQRAREAVTGWIAQESKQAAENTKMTPKEAAKMKADKIAEAVAKAAEPYHLALLRSQKFVVETYSKAKTAQQSSVVLQTKARQMALTAQGLQAAGVGVDAQEMMSTAHGVMNEAETMRQWAAKLYNQANTAQSSIGGYTNAEQQAATNAAMTTIVNAPMALPPA